MIDFVTLHFDMLVKMVEMDKNSKGAYVNISITSSK